MKRGKNGGERSSLRDSRGRRFRPSLPTADDAKRLLWRRPNVLLLCAVGICLTYLAFFPAVIYSGRRQFDARSIRIANHRTRLHRYPIAGTGENWTLWPLYYSSWYPLLSIVALPPVAAEYRQPSPGSAAALCGRHFRPYAFTAFHRRDRIAGGDARPAPRRHLPRSDNRVARLRLRHRRDSLQPGLLRRTLCSGC